MLVFFPLSHVLELRIQFSFPFSENSGLHVFDFLANSILKEVLLSIQKAKPGAFSPGRPTEFLKNYKASLDFLAHLEGSHFCALPVFLIPMLTLVIWQSNMHSGIGAFAQ